MKFWQSFSLFFTLICVMAGIINHIDGRDITIWFILFFLNGISFILHSLE